MLFHPWVSKISWRREWQCTPIFLPGESPWTEEPGKLESMGVTKESVGHDWSYLVCRRVPLTWLFHVAIPDWITIIEYRIFWHPEYQSQDHPLSWLGPSGANFSSVQEGQEGWIVFRAQLGHFCQKKAKWVLGRQNQPLPSMLASTVSPHEIVCVCFKFPCLQKSLYFAMWCYLPRTLHLCLRKINTQPICRLYLP